MEKGQTTLVELLNKNGNSFTVGSIFLTVGFVILSISRSTEAPRFLFLKVTEELRTQFPVIPILTYADCVIILSLFIGAWIIWKTLSSIKEKVEQKDRLLINAALFFSILVFNSSFFVHKHKPARDSLYYTYPLVLHYLS